MKNSKINVFISYSKNDGDVAHKIAKHLKCNAHLGEVFIDKDNLNNNPIQSWIDGSILNSQVSLIICTQSYYEKTDETNKDNNVYEKSYVNYEYSVLLDRRQKFGMIIIPVKLVNQKNEHVIPAGLSPYQPVIISQEPKINELEDLVEEIIKRSSCLHSQHLEDLFIKLSKLDSLEKAHNIELMFVHVKINDSSVRFLDYEISEYVEEEQDNLLEFFDKITGGEEKTVGFLWSRGQKYRTFAFSFNNQIKLTCKAAMEFAKYISNREGLNNTSLKKDYTFTIFITRGYAYFHEDPFKRGDMILDKIERLPKNSEDVFYIDDTVYNSSSSLYKERFFHDTTSPIGFKLYRNKELTRRANNDQIKKHISANQYAFALEVSIRNHEQMDDEESKSILKNNIKIIDLNMAYPTVMAINSLLYFSRCICGIEVDLSLKNDIFKIRRLIDRNVSRYPDFHESYLLNGGRSPLDPNILRPLNEKVSSYKKTGTVHDQCCLCYAWLGISAYLSGLYPELVNEISEFLKSQKPKMYRSQGGQLRDWRYTSKVLLFASIIGDRSWADDVAEVILNSENWLEHSEWNSILERGGLIHSIVHYCMMFKIDQQKLSNWSRFAEELDILVREIEKTTPAPICLDGLIGVVAYLRSELRHSRRDIRLEEIIEREIEYMKKNSLWDSGTGTWGYEKQRTSYRIELWLEYIEWKCELYMSIGGNA